MDIDSPESSQQLYSCKLCEVDLDISDLKQLGLSEEFARGRKRLRRVLVDEKVTPLLKESKSD